MRQVGNFELFRCGCGLKFLPESQLQNVDYNTLYADDAGYSSKVVQAKELKSASFVHGKSKNRALQIALAANPASAVEIGCGVGDFLACLDAAGIPTFGTDVSDRALELARSHLRHSRLSHGIFTRNTFANQRFDLAASFEVIEHVSLVRSFLDEIFASINPGGLLLLTTPNYDSRLTWLDIAHDPRSGPPIHVTYWNAASLRAALLQAGFSSVKIERHSIPLRSARRAGNWLDRLAVVPRSVLFRSQRKTLLAIAQK